MHAASVHPEPGSNSRMFVSKEPCGSFNQYPSYDLALLLLLECDIKIAIKKELSRFRRWLLIFLFRTILIVVQFSRIISWSFRALIGASRRQPTYYITLDSVCQVLFQKFLKFSWFCHPTVRSDHRFLVTTRLLYHTSNALSILFRKFLKIFFKTQ